jgi:putative heme-binding domain-containing protein
LKLVTDPHAQSVRYALQIPGYDLAYNLSGVEAKWLDANREVQWTGWLPHFDPEVNEAWMARSADHAKLQNLMKKEGALTMRARADNMIVGNATLQSDNTGRMVFSSLVRTPIKRATRFVWTTETDPTERQIPLDGLLLPWAPERKAPLPQPEKETEITGGDYERGRELFFSQERRCSTCHRIRGEGATIGPDLSNLSHRDPAAVLRDIQQPSLAINPDYVAYNVVLKNGGDEPSGFVRGQNSETLRLLGIDGKERTFKHSEVEALRVSNVSLMPEGLLQGLSDHDVRSLLTFLVTAAPQRNESDVGQFLETSTLLKRALKLVLVASKQDHGPNQHDYPAWQKKWAPMLKADTAWEWPSEEQWKSADVMVFYFWNHDWSEARLAQLDAFQNRGGGVVMFHAACIADKEPEKLAERIGLSAQPNVSKYLHTPFNLKLVAPTNNALGLKPVELPLVDEPYWPLIGNTNNVQVLATAEVESEPRPLVWTFQRGKGRVFVSIPSHYTWTWEDPVFVELARRAIAWAGGEIANSK